MAIRASVVSAYLRSQGVVTIPSGSTVKGVRVTDMPSIGEVCITITDDLDSRARRIARIASGYLVEGGYTVQPNQGDPTILFVRKVQP